MLDNPTIEISWTGPYAWPGCESACDLPTIPMMPGVYLQTFDYRGGYMIYGAGITRRPVPARFYEHTREYMSGNYNVLDMQAIAQGIRREIWHGWGWSPEKRAEFEACRLEVVDAVKKQLSAFRVFVAGVTSEGRILERIEAATMNHLYRESKPFCDIPDKGMMLAPRWRNEALLTGRNTCEALLHRLPLYLEI